MSLLTTTILIIEDDLSVQAAFAEVLRWEEHPLVIVATVQEAEDALQRVGSAGIWLVMAARGRPGGAVGRLGAAPVSTAPPARRP